MKLWCGSLVVHTERDPLLEVLTTLAAFPGRAKPEGRAWWLRRYEGRTQGAGFEPA